MANVQSAHRTVTALRFYFVLSLKNMKVDSLMLLAENILVHV